MPKLELLEKYAKLIVEVGANVQKNQMVVVEAPTDTKELTRLIVKAGYNAGAKGVLVLWSDPYVSRYDYEGKSIENLELVPEWEINRMKYLIENNGCLISVSSPVPEVNKGVDPIKMQRAGIAKMKSLKFVQEYMMENHTQWTMAAAPNKAWAKKVFPNIDEEEAVETLWEAILNSSHVTENNDPIKEWEDHNRRLLSRNKKLNDFQFDSLHFKNGLGTDLRIKLVENHIWAGGGETTTKGVYFNPNIPTEENFTMPDKFGAEGKVFATKPLDYQGNQIENFWLEFKEGKVVNYYAEKKLETLKNILEFDEGSVRLGEVALISYNSPINKTGILFFNTLFDENASCHLALGRAIPWNIKGGTAMTPDELTAAGGNLSMLHIDLMFGSKDMQVEGIQKEGKKVVIFKDGDFVI